MEVLILSPHIFMDVLCSLGEKAAHFGGQAYITENKQLSPRSPVCCVRATDSSTTLIPSYPSGKIKILSLTLRLVMRI